MVAPLTEGPPLGCGKCGIGPDLGQTGITIEAGRDETLKWAPQACKDTPPPPQACKGASPQACEGFKELDRQLSSDFPATVP